MKKAYILLLIIAPIFAGCSSDDLENLTTISSDVELSQQIDVIVPPSTDAFSTTKTFDASQEDEFVRFENRIDAVVVERVEYTILSVQENPNDAQITSAQLAFINGSSRQVIGDITGLNIAGNIGNTIPLNVDQSVIDAMGATFKSEGKITVEATALVDNSPVDFDLEVTIDLKVSGSVIK